MTLAQAHDRTNREVGVQRCSPSLVTDYRNGKNKSPSPLRFDRLKGIPFGDPASAPPTRRPLRAFLEPERC